MEYRVIAVYSWHYNGISSALEELEKKVKCYIQKNWKPLGGVTISSDGIILQAMIKEA